MDITMREQRCGWCSSIIEQSTEGRPRQYCSDACKMMRYRDRRDKRLTAQRRIEQQQHELRQIDKMRGIVLKHLDGVKMPTTMRANVAERIAVEYITTFGQQRLW